MTEPEFWREAKDVNSLYPYIEFIKVLAAYAALLYIWPNLVFNRYLKGKGLTVRFAFCSMVQPVLFNGIILGLGLFGILNVWTVRGLFWGALLYSAGKALIPKNRRTVSPIKTLYSYVRETIPEKGRKVCQEYKSRLPEYLMLIFILLFGIAYFSIGTLQDYSYGCYDHYTHYQWVLDLRQGQIFSEGIYPQAMHCFIYGIRYLFGVNLHSCLLFLAGIHISAFLTAAYCLLKEVFQNRCIPLFVLTAWLTFDAGMQGEVMHPAYLSMNRLMWTYPQEFGTYLVFLCPLFLLRFFRTEDNIKETAQWFENENLILLMLGISAATAIHFYVLILAFFLCLPIPAIHFKKMFSIKKIRLLTYTVGNGLCVGAFPMVTAYSMGAYLEKSLRWGIDRFQGISEDAVSFHTGVETSGGSHGNIIKTIYEKGCVDIFGRQGAVVLAIMSFIIVICWCGCCLHIRDWKYKKQWPVKVFEGYFFIVCTSSVMVFLYAAPYTGLPEFVAVDRIFSIIKMLIFSVPFAFIDFMFFYAASKTNVKIKKYAAVLGCAVIYCFAYLTDFHEYMFTVMKRYNAAVFVTEKVTKTFDSSSYMIVSMQDEKGQMEETWRHVELLEFVQNTEKEEYCLPAEYIFLYVEKRPLLQGQIHYFTGPSWLAGPSSLFDPNDKGKSQCPDVVHTEISWEMSQQEISYHSELGDNYFDQTVRTALCSKAYYWYQSFKETHPMETEIYYEDDDFACYLIHQNPELPLNLSLRRKNS